MFKLPDQIPTLRSSTQEWADYAEYLALKSGQISLYNLVKRPMMVSDETIVSGIEDSTDRFNDKADEIAMEIKKRKVISRERYPYYAANLGYSINYERNDDQHNWIYRFLLLSTRLNMTNHKVQNGLDGTQLFERLSAEVAKQFFGTNAEADILGTSKAQAGGFRTKLKELTKRIGEGGEPHNNAGYQPQDDNIDVILWKGFTDKQPSQIIAFGQCKTGTSWSDRLSELNVDAFMKTWFSMHPVLTPIRMFFCAQYFPKEIWRPRANEAGLVFDRFRILDYLPESLPVDLMNDIKSWLLGAEALN
ncbi:hypothetical protein ACFQZX_17855 [Mucilaginibacter litoreus]|uniref:Restriction endonuclease n=1 Tax=Mucilaginibacter litoreus TaxID=1048221 RepID=A0ABW3AX70_9SPHI